MNIVLSITARNYELHPNVSGYVKIALTAGCFSILKIVASVLAALFYRIQVRLPITGGKKLNQISPECLFY